MNRRAEILVVGGGPTGLSMSLQAHAHGARVGVVERRQEVSRPSRALILHPRTLEVLRPLGVTEALLAQADPELEALVYLGHRSVSVRLAKLSMPDTAFPHLSLARQTDVERVLADACEERGIKVERGTELIDVKNDQDCALATLRSAEGTKRTEFDFVVGCDGQESTVRRRAGISWPGAAYAEEAVLADAELDGNLASNVAHVAVGPHGLLFVFAHGEHAAWRLLATRQARAGSFPFGDPGPAITQAELQTLIYDAGLDARITDLVWSARYRLQHRLAEHFREGRLYVAGDAAHAHSPATGQGMNTGIQDAINLGWKLALSSSSSNPEALLQSYELERRPVARRLLALTHLAFLAEASSNSLLSLLRGVLAPLGAPMVPILTGHRALVTEVIRIVSQWRMNYASSALSAEGMPHLAEWPRSGNRLPDREVTCEGRVIRLHTLLARPGIHILLSQDVTRVQHLPFSAGVTIHRLTDIPGTGVVAVRPDGYIGFRCGVFDEAQLRTWLALVGS